MVFRGPNPLALLPSVGTGALLVTSLSSRFPFVARGVQYNSYATGAPALTNWSSQLDSVIPVLTGMTNLRGSFNKWLWWSLGDRSLTSGLLLILKTRFPLSGGEMRGDMAELLLRNVIDAFALM